MVPRGWRLVALAGAGRRWRRPALPAVGSLDNLGWVSIAAVKWRSPFSKKYTEIREMIVSGPKIAMMSSAIRLAHHHLVQPTDQATAGPLARCWPAGPPFARWRRPAAACPPLPSTGPWASTAPGCPPAALCPPPYTPPNGLTRSPLPPRCRPHSVSLSTRICATPPCMRSAP